MIYVVDVADYYYPSGGGSDWVLVTRDLEAAKARAMSEISSAHNLKFATVIGIDEGSLDADTVFDCNNDG